MKGPITRAEVAKVSKTNLRSGDDFPIASP
jgi:hypothetical protein